ncbi:HlyD family secretion protein [Amycolatopsis xylanica]|uniref:HlyD family secretion protein n=1 Tax=Amycolatopsis xylanica TaxID=589385 RepID=A0A1H3PJV1_9PSEU|nr:HlyD family efflux transporter periplasmic adaptor subunit [Amycolatopsis xylanica]SDZ01462.1 HlyD family secretion protein [Amycolatopsis xylanica]
MKFRREALRTLESPEQLDEVSRLAPVPAWLTTLVMAVVVLVTGAWAAFGTVPRTVSAQGVLTHFAGVSALDATEQGQVGAVWTAPNQRVEKGQPLYSVLGRDGTTKTVVSPWTAHVISLVISPGQWLEPGKKVADLERLDTPGDRLRALVYVPAGSAPLLYPGMHVELTTSAAPVNVYGSFAGTVSSVGSFPETDASLHAFLGDARDVRPFLGSGPVVAVTVDLVSVPDTATGLKWSRTAPPFALNSQSEVSAAFTVADEHPISWLVGR